MNTYESRLRIDIAGNSSTKFFTESGLHVVIGKRGPYIEFSDDQTVKGSITVPEKEKYRLDADYVYYHEYRTIRDYVKLYYQDTGSVVRSK